MLKHLLAGHKPFGFFEPGILALPMGAISFVLIILLGPLVLPVVWQHQRRFSGFRFPLGGLSREKPY